MYGLSKEEDIGGLFLKTVRSSETPWGVGWLQNLLHRAGEDCPPVPALLHPPGRPHSVSPWAGLLALSPSPGCLVLNGQE